MKFIIDTPEEEGIVQYGSNTKDAFEKFARKYNEEGPAVSDGSVLFSDYCKVTDMETGKVSWLNACAEVHLNYYVEEKEE